MGDVSDIAEWKAARWSALRVLLHGLLIPALEQWPDVKQGLSLWRRSLYVRPPRSLLDQEDESTALRANGGRRPAGRIVQARLDMWPLVDPQARADMARLASLYEGLELPVPVFVAAVRQGGWDLTRRRAGPLLRGLVSEEVLQRGRRGHYAYDPAGPGEASLSEPHVELSRVLNDLGPVLRQRFEQVLGAKLWVVGRAIEAERLRPLATTMFERIVGELDRIATDPAKVVEEETHDYSFIRCGLLAVPEAENKGDVSPPGKALELAVATAGADFGQEIGDFGRADEVLQKELIETLVGYARESEGSVQQVLKDRFGLGTWRTYDRWRKQRSMDEIEASEADRAAAWLEGWALEELSAMWPLGLPLTRLVARLQERAKGRWAIEREAINAVLGGMIQRDLVRRTSTDRNVLAVAQPCQLVSASTLATLEHNLITALRPLPASLGEFEQRSEHFTVRTGMWCVERARLPELVERIRKQIADVMDASYSQEEEKQPERAVVPARIFVTLRPSPLLP